AAGGEVRHRHQVELAERILVAEVVLEPIEQLGRGVERVAGELLGARRSDQPYRRAAGARRTLDLDERPDAERDQVAGNRRRLGEADGLVPSRRRLAEDLAVRDRAVPRLGDDGELELRLELRLV